MLTTNQWARFGSLPTEVVHSALEAWAAGRSRERSLHRCRHQDLGTARLAARTCPSSEQLLLNKAFWEVKGREGGLLEE